MAAHQGVVEFVKPNSAGFYSVKLPDAWYGTGQKVDPNLRQGDVIKFEYEMRGDFRNMVKGTLVKVEGGAQAGNAQPRSTYVPETNRQASIIYQSSRKDAIEIIKAAQASGCLALPTKKADQFDALLDLVDELTVKLAVKATAADITGTTASSEEGEFNE